MEPGRLGGERPKAEAEVAALALNEAAGHLEGCERAGRALDRALRLLDQGDWRRAWEVAHDVNSGRGVRRCDGQSALEDEDDRDEGHEDAERPGKAGQRGKAKGKSKKK
jgi:hypothetical protein